LLSVSLYLFYRHSWVHRVLEGLGPRFRTLYTSLQEVGARAPRRVELLFSLLRCRRTTPWPSARLWRKQGGNHIRGRQCAAAASSHVRVAHVLREASVDQAHDPNSVPSTCGVRTTQMCISYTQCTARLCQLHSQTLEPSFLRPPHTHEWFGGRACALRRPAGAPCWQRYCGPYEWARLGPVPALSFARRV
jgi:hypothetical protein